MNTNNPFALLGEDDNLLLEEPNQTSKKKNQKGGNNNNNRGGNTGGNTQSDKPRELTAAERRAKAEKTFKQRNALSEEEKKQRNKSKKQKKVEKINKKGNPTSPAPQPAKGAATPTTTTPATGAGSKPGETKPATAAAASTQPAAAPVKAKTEEELRKEQEANRDKKLQEYLSAVNSALPGSTIFFKLNLNELQKDSNQVINDLQDRWKSSVDRIISSDLFLAKFLGSLPAAYKNRTAAEVIPVGRYEMRGVPFAEFPVHLAALLAGPTDNGERKPSDEVVSLVEGFLEGLFDHKPKVNARAKFFNDEEGDDDVNEYVGSGGNSRSNYSLADFITKLPEDKPAAGTSSSSTASSSTAGSSSSSSADKGKEKEGESPVVKEKAQEGASLEAGRKDAHNPVSYLSEEVKGDADKLRGLAKKIPRGWRFGYVSSPMFAPSTAALKSQASSGGGRGGGRGGDRGGRGGRGGNRGGGGGRGEGRGEGNSNEREKVKYDAGFMYSANGLDHSYVMWRGNEMVFLFTTGKERVSSAPAVAAEVAPEKKEEKKPVDLTAIQANGKPAWKQPRKDI